MNKYWRGLVFKRLTFLKNSPAITGGGFLLLAMMVANMVNFVFNAVLGRELSFAEFGLVTLVNTFWYVLRIPLGALSGTVNHRVAYLEAKQKSAQAAAFTSAVRNKSLTVALVVSAIWLVATIQIAQFFHISPLVVLFFAPVITLSALTAVNVGYLQGRFHFLAVGYAVLLEPIIKLGFALLFLLAGQQGLVYSSIPLSLVPAFLLTLVLTGRELGKSSDSTSSKQSAFFQFAFPRRFYLSALFMSLSTNMFLSLDLILAKHYLSANEAGEYSLLSLIGKMIFFFGSLLQIFIIPFVARDQGLRHDPQRNFYRVFAVVSALVFLAFLGVGPLGYVTVPLLLGDKTEPILPYLTNYTFALSLFTLASTIILYHLARKQYLFPLAGIVFAGLLSMGIIQSHRSIADFTLVLRNVSLYYLGFTLALHLLLRNGFFILRNLLDLIDLGFPLPQTRMKPNHGKRILIFNWRDTKHSYAGGAEVYLHELGKHWAKAGNIVTLFCGNDGKCPRNEVVDGVQVIRRGGFYFVYIWAFLYYVVKFRGRYDIILDSQNGIPFFTPVYAKEPVYCIIHHVHQEVFRRSLSKPLALVAIFLEKVVMPWAYHRTKFIAISQSTRADMLKLDIPNSGIEIVSPGVDIQMLKPNGKSKTPLIVYLGRLKAYKSIDVLIKAFKQVLQQIPQARLLIVGNGEEGDKLRNLCKQLDLSKQVTFTGRVTELEKIRFLQNAWVLVNPSYMEGWGITTIEANACGTPVIASDVPGLRDSVHNPLNGVLVPYGDVSALARNLVELLRNKPLLTQMSLASRKWAENFAWEVSVAKSLQLFNRPYSVTTSISISNEQVRSSVSALRDWLRIF